MGLQGPVSLLSHHYIDMVVFKLLILMLIVELTYIHLIKEMIGNVWFHFRMTQNLFYLCRFDFVMLGCS